MPDAVCTSEDMDDNSQMQESNATFDCLLSGIHAEQARRQR